MACLRKALWLWDKLSDGSGEDALRIALESWRSFERPGYYRGWLYSQCTPSLNSNTAISVASQLEVCLLSLRVHWRNPGIVRREYCSWMKKTQLVRNATIFIAIEYICRKKENIVLIIYVKVLKWNYNFPVCFAERMVLWHPWSMERFSKAGMKYF